MKARLENHTEQKQLMMTDLKPGDVAVVLDYCEDNSSVGTAIGSIVTCFRDTERYAAVTSIGSNSVWNLGKCSNVPVRLLQPGDKIVLSE